MRLNASVLNEILGIIVGIQSTENVKAVNVYANCKSAINRVKEAQREGSKSLLHLVYEPMLSEFRENKRKQHSLKHIVQK